jgi:hypothetical protein
LKFEDAEYATSSKLSTDADADADASDFWPITFSNTGDGHHLLSFAINA